MVLQLLKVNEKAIQADNADDVPSLEVTDTDFIMPPESFAQY
jgi:hypothetical protein